MQPLERIPSCKRFNGYKPCFDNYNWWLNGCKENIPIGYKILIINLDAMGDVLMTTAQLQSLKKTFPQSTIYWITAKVSAPLLLNNPLIDFVFSYDFESISILQSMKFDYVFNVDKSQRSCALLNSISSNIKRGFGLDYNGKIAPVNEGAYYNYLLGMDNNLKFKINKMTGQEYLAETFEIEYKRNDYIFNFTEDEIKFIKSYKKEIGLTENDFVIGFNTGCSNLFPNKKMTVEQHNEIIEKLLSYKKFKIALFGGPEDKERNDAIYSNFKFSITNTPTNLGVRKGACFMDISNVVITGDSFGMHMAIALKKHVIAWFGLSCWTEIDLYERGIKIFPENLDCAPCWKKSCPFDLECIKMIDLIKIENEVLNFYNSIIKTD